MTLKQFRTIRMVITFFLAMIVSQSIINGNYMIPLMASAISAIFLYFIRQKVKEIVADERDYEIGGKSARITIQIFSWIAVIIMLILYSMRNTDPIYEAIALTLSYSVCFLLIAYGLIFKYFYRK